MKNIPAIFFLKGFIIVLFIFTMTISSRPAMAGKDEVEDLFTVAQKAFDDGFYDVAVGSIEQLTRRFPNSGKYVQAQLLLGQCYFFKSQYLKAYHAFHDLLSYSEYQDATLFWVGETHVKAGDVQQARIYYRKLIEIYPESSYIPQAYYSMAWTYFDDKDYETAKKVFQRMSHLFPAHPLSEEADFRVGECAFHLKSYEIAGQYFQQYLAKYPHSTRQAQSYFYIGESLYYLQDYLSAVTYYAQTAELAYDPRLTLMAKIGMGWSYLKLERHSLSLRYFQEARQLSEEKKILSDDVYLGIATLYTDMGEHAQALEAYSALIERFPQSPHLASAYLGRANLAYILKDYPRAIESYQGILTRYAEDSIRQEIVEKAHYGLAWTYLKSGDIDQAIANFQMIRDKSESKIVKISAMTQIADAYQDIDQMEKAIDVYDQILKDYSDSPYTDYVQFRQGVALLKLEKIDAAAMSFHSLQTKFPRSRYLPDVEYYLGLTYFKKDNWPRTIEHIQKYLMETPEPQAFAAEAQYLLAYAYFYAQDYPQALASFEKLKNYYPPDHSIVRSAHLHMAKCLYHMGKTEEALEKFQMMIDAFPDAEIAQESILWLGEHYLSQNDIPKAVSFYEHFLAQYPGSDKGDMVRFTLGQAYQSMDQWDKALNFYKMIPDSADKLIYAKARLAIAGIFSMEFDSGIAIATYQQIANTVPEFQRDAYTNMAQIYTKDGNYSAAIKAYQTALSCDKALSQLDPAQIQFLIGDSFESLNESDQAVTSYLKIPYLYGEDSSWVIKAYLRIARIFENQEKWDEARLTYDKITRLQSEESKYARERLDWINAKQASHPNAIQ
jgi:tetratricopeptide (TPR) repeat protein